MAKTQNGYIIISDITGYTGYLNESELEHAEDVLRSLLNTIIAYTKIPLVISRLEGDAVISYALEHSILQGQTMVELMETCYVAFRRAIELMILNTSCTCNACKNISKLDLKFFIHYGTFMLQPFPAYTELIGTDVNIAHRLTKNHVTEQTGLRAYALYSKAAVEALELQEFTETLPKLTEQYEHIGAVEVFIQNMHAVWDEKRDQARVFVKLEEAFLIIEETFPLDQVHAWDYVTKPEYKAVFGGSESAEVLNMKTGRIGVGATYLCAHGAKNDPQTIVDWQPFEQYTYTPELPGGLTGLVTIQLTPHEKGTNVANLWKVEKGNVILRKLLQIFGKTLFLPMLRKYYANSRLQIEKDIEAGILVRPEAIEVNLEEIGRSIRQSLAEGKS